MKVDFKHIEWLVESLEYKYAFIEGTTSTICKAILPNGFMVATGESACVDPKEFNKELGMKIAQERAKQEAINELWKLEGYLLKVIGKTSDKL